MGLGFGIQGLGFTLQGSGFPGEQAGGVAFDLSLLQLVADNDA